MISIIDNEDFPERFWKIEEMSRHGNRTISMVKGGGWVIYDHNEISDEILNNPLKKCTLKKRWRNRLIDILESMVWEIEETFEIFDKLKNLSS